MRRATADLIGSGLLLTAAASATFAVLAPPAGVGTAAAFVQPLSQSALDAERGRTLFYAKGCVACHKIAGLSAGMAVGPELTDLASHAATRRPGLSAEAYVAESLREPDAFTAPRYPSGEMPKLALRDDEVAALIAFLLRRP